MQTDSVTTKPRRAFPFYWPIAVVVLLLGHSLLLGVAMMVASTTPGGASIPTGYREAVAWDQMQSERREGERLGWRLEVRASPVTNLDGSREVRFDLLDAQGAPVADCELAITTYHQTRPTDVLIVEPVPLAEGSYVATLAMRRAGLWRVEAVVDNEGERRRIDTTYWLPESGGAAR